MPGASHGLRESSLLQFKKELLKNTTVEKYRSLRQLNDSRSPAVSDILTAMVPRSFRLL